MKLIESYSLSAGVPIIHKHDIIEHFYPLGDIQQYITIQNSSGMPAKNYSLYQEVVDILFPILQKNNISILVLGDKDSPPLTKTVNLCGFTSIHQTAYVVKRSSLHLGNDSWLCHLAGSYDIPLVALYGPTSVANHSPFFYNKDKTIFLESHRNGKLPTFSREEHPKTIDLINPEQVANSVLSILGLSSNYPYNTMVIGDSYKNNRVIESVPNDVVNISNLGINNLVIRLDFLFNEENLMRQLQVCPCSIVTNKPIRKEILKGYAPRITQIYYILDDNQSVQFVKDCQEIGVKVAVFSYKSQEWIDNLKLSYYESCVIFKKDVPSQKSFEVLKDKSAADLYYRSSKFTLSAGKLYPSYASFLSNIHIDSFDCPVLPIINSEDWWKESEYFYILHR